MILKIFYLQLIAERCIFILLTVVIVQLVAWVIKRKFNQWRSTIPPISTKWTTTSRLKTLNMKNSFKRPQHMALKMQVLAWDRYINMVGLTWLMGSPLPPPPFLDHWISNNNAENEKIFPDSLPLNKTSLSQKWITT